MRLLAIAAVYSALLTLTAALALRAADATLAVVAVAAVTVLLGWFAQLHATEEHSAIGLANPAWAAALAVVGRRPWSTLLPAVVAHVVGGVAGGFAALALEDRLGDTLVFADPGLVAAAAGAALVALIGTWAVLLVDGGGSEALVAVPALVSGGVLPLGLLAAFQPAATVGLATAGLVPWDAALVAAGTVVVVGMLAALVVSQVVPQE